MSRGPSIVPFLQKQGIRGARSTKQRRACHRAEPRLGHDELSPGQGIPEDHSLWASSSVAAPRLEARKQAAAGLHPIDGTTDAEGRLGHLEIVEHARLTCE